MSTDENERDAIDDAQEAAGVMSAAVWDEPPASDTPLVFIYDRCTTANTTVLELRLKACVKYVSRNGWDFGGWWVDKGDDALTDDQRPAFDALLRFLEATGDTRPRVCLVHDWSRLSRDGWNRRMFIRRVTLAGGWVETITGETSKPEDARLGLLTGASDVEAADA